MITFKEWLVQEKEWDAEYKGTKPERPLGKPNPRFSGKKGTPWSNDDPERNRHAAKKELRDKVNKL